MRRPGRAMYQLSPVALCWVPNRPPPPHDDAQGHRHRELAARHVAVLGQLVDDRVAGRRQEVREHDLDDGPHARDGHAQGDADEAVLADRRGQDASRELLRQADVGLEHAAVGADVLAHEEDRRIGRHLVVERGVDRLAIGQLGRDRARTQRRGPPQSA